MTRRILLAPTSHDSGLSSTCLGLIHALDERGIDVGYLKPLAQATHGHPDHTTDLVRLVTDLNPPDPISATETEHAFARGHDDDLMERVLSHGEDVLSQHDVVVIEGLVPTEEHTYSGRINIALAKSLDAEVVLVASAHGHSVEHVVSLMAGAEASYRVGGEISRVIGAVLTRVPTDGSGPGIEAYRTALAQQGIRLVGAVPYLAEATWPRVRDMQRELRLTVLSQGDLDRRIRANAIMAQSVLGSLSVLTEGRLVVVPGDRHDVLLAACLAAMNGTRLAGMVLTAGLTPDPKLMAMCQPALATGLPMLLAQGQTFDTANQIVHMNKGIADDDEPRTQVVMQLTADNFNEDWLAGLAESSGTRRLSPAAFRRELTVRSRVANKRIVLPEGAEPRTVQAAVICAEKGVARCVLLAAPAEVEAVASSLGLELPEGIEIIDPVEAAPRYIPALVERRRHKGMTEQIAVDQLSDTVVLGTMMVYLGEVDGLVSGAVHTTANTVRPALQILGTKPGAKLVSSVFFMGLPDEVVVYGDCAINPDPNAEELADIAIQSADSATAFGIEPRVAMISFSTGSSGAGADVQKVARATELVKELRPDILVDGPLQYDAATTASVAKSKAPDSPVAGNANVFIFPDLNTGNTTYKAVQRSASVISVGPMLQGIAAPVNDLSRGALVEDIEYTIALTAIQAAAG
ncbi:phosphate acetyltransferase [Kineosphaera limosa]|uniref:Phosphate acetyltransferase n=1 Tax=Kineosphaera limosa NBRC 100340 TaxID=1184609 RepID=K6WB50_9MICO|nr:phosphate acetyltransferase [Kineosphaera limosa]NYE01747.1 phosphate acetyltransferase [Kineosphaera limosa]GAB96455.1 phosphate acetyltransferase [Kineosphaera limosa NBRC 100340]